MDARNLTAIPHSDAGSLEVIVPDGDAAIRWSSHGYPSSLAKWHYHPQIEIHLIREGSGQLMPATRLKKREKVDTLIAAASAAPCKLTSSRCVEI